MCRIAWLLLSAGVCVGIGAAADPPAGGTFFDGKTLDGFDGLKQYWKVVDGAIVGSTEPGGLTFNTFLCSKAKYKDFELKFQVRLKGAGANSGVQIRSELKDPKTFAVWGPQCDMGQEYWGCLFGEHFNPGGQHVMLQQAPADKVKQVLKPSDYNDLVVQVSRSTPALAAPLPPAILSGGLLLAGNGLFEG